MFVDRAKIRIKSGKGGNGAVTFRRDPYVPNGGPDGGDGGKGGSIIFKADRNLRTLMDFKYKRKYEAEAGQNGMSRNKFGKDGENLIIKVPMGTVVIDEETGRIMKDLVEDGDSFVAAKGGKGGRGNVHFKSSIRQAPNFAEAGGEAKERAWLKDYKQRQITEKSGWEFDFTRGCAWVKKEDKSCGDCESCEGCEGCEEE